MNGPTFPWQIALLFFCCFPLPTCWGQPFQYDAADAYHAEREASPSAADERIAAILARPLSYSVGPGPMLSVLENLAATNDIPLELPLEPLAPGLPPTRKLFRLPASQMPLGIQLKHSLRPYGLRPLVYKGALWIVTDTAQLISRNRNAASLFTNVDDAYIRQTETLFAKKITIESVNVPLDFWLDNLATKTGIQFSINVRALEDLGLTREVPISIQLRDTSTLTVLEAALAIYDLELRPRNEYIEITTDDDAEDPVNALTRIYWLEGTGFTREVSDLSTLIQTAITPDTWEALGGPSVIARLTRPKAAASPTLRTGIVVSTTYQVHRQVEQLLNGLRQGTHDPRTQYSSSY